MAATKAQWNALLEDVRAGATRTSAAKRHGISKEFVLDQVTRGTKAGLMLLQAEGEAQVTAEHGLMAAGTVPDKNGRRDSKAAIQWLTNRDHENWREKREETVNVNHRLQDELAERRKKLPPTMREKLREVGAEMILGEALPKAPADVTVH